MADNVTFQTSVATPPRGFEVATDDIDDVAYQRMKLIHGADGVNDGDVSATNPFPIREKVSPYILYFYDDDGVLEYLCQHATYGTATSAVTWEVTKFTYAVSGAIASRGTLVGSVDGRAALGWV